MDNKIAEVTIKLDRNKLLDEAVFLSICGLQQCRENFAITGVTRLEMARDRLNVAIDVINKNLEKGMLNGEECHY